MDERKPIISRHILWTTSINSHIAVNIYSCKTNSCSGWNVTHGALLPTACRQAGMQQHKSPKGKSVQRSKQCAEPQRERMILHCSIDVQTHLCEQILHEIRWEIHGRASSDLWFPITSCVETVREGLGSFETACKAAQVNSSGLSTEVWYSVLTKPGLLNECLLLIIFFPCPLNAG